MSARSGAFARAPRADADADADTEIVAEAMSVLGTMFS